MCSSDLVDGRDARMAEARDGDGFRAEALGDFRIVQLGVENFDGDLAVQDLVHRAIHGPHAAASDAVEDVILADGAPDHDWFSAGRPGREISQSRRGDLPCQF